MRYGVPSSIKRLEIAFDDLEVRIKDQAYRDFWPSPSKESKENWAVKLD
jgi:hypothetical protein